MEIILTSRKMGKNYPAAIYSTDMGEGRVDYIIYHKSLHDIFMGLEEKERPKKILEPFDLTKWPSIPPMFAVKCTLGDTSAIGEMTCLEWQQACEMGNVITANNPIAICTNRAFDKAFIQYMNFYIQADGVILDGRIYSSAEISDMRNTILLTGRNAPAPQPAPQPSYSQPQCQQPSPMTNMPTQQKQMNGQEPRTNSPQSKLQGNQNWSQAPGQKGNVRHEPKSVPEIPGAAPHGNAKQQNNRQSGQLAGQTQGVTQQPNQIRPTIIDIDHDQASHVSRVTTDAGIVYFDHKTNMWASDNIDLKRTDLGWLYNMASKEVGQPFETFCGCTN